MGSEILAGHTPSGVDADQRAKRTDEKRGHEPNMFAENPSDVAAEIESDEYAEFHGPH